MKTIPVTAADAPLPNAVRVFQRAWTPRIAYRLSEQLQDRRRGRRDRARVSALLALPPAEIPVPATPWLHVLGRACAGHLATEHRDARALIAVIDHDLVSAHADQEGAESDLRLARDRRDAIEAETPALDRRQVETDGEDVAEARAGRARATRVAEANALVNALEARLTAAQVRIASLLEDRASHWELLQRRVAVILAHFDTRAATYADGATRRGEAGSFAPRVERPAWVGAPVPEAPLGEPVFASDPADRAG